MYDHKTIGQIALRQSLNGEEKNMIGFEAKRRLTENCCPNS